jgi:chromate transporter
VGVILNLAINFATHTLCPEPSHRVDGVAAGIALAAIVAMQRFKIGLMPALGVCALLGLVIKFTHDRL